jgi:hypothetical protein
MNSSLPGGTPVYYPITNVTYSSIILLIFRRHLMQRKSSIQQTVT